MIYKKTEGIPVRIELETRMLLIRKRCADIRSLLSVWDDGMHDSTLSSMEDKVHAFVSVLDGLLYTQQAEMSALIKEFTDFMSDSLLENSKKEVKNDTPD